MLAVRYSAATGLRISFGVELEATKRQSAENRTRFHWLGAWWALIAGEKMKSDCECGK
jgi:hypothetical protein